jgi:phosphatidylglycerol:prolipoprotein diacylglycerol transferase
LLASYVDQVVLIKIYGTILALAVLLGAYVSSIFARQRGKDGQIVWDALLWVLPFGLLGARIYHVLSLWDFYARHPRAIFFLWNGGLAIYGALIGGLVGLLVWVKGLKGTKGVKEKTAEILDIAAPGLAIAQSVGRFANYFNHELYGWPTNLPWGIFVPPRYRFPGLSEFAYFQPLFWYESILSLFNFALLVVVARKFSSVLKAGDLFLLYLATYSLGRFFLEPLRIESWTVHGFRVAQLVALFLFVVAVSLAVFRRVPLKNFQLNLFSK